jgi:hypothetical protein
MHTQSAQNQLEFQGLGCRKVVAQFDGGTISSDGGTLLLREVDLRAEVLDRFASCFEDLRHPAYVEHSVRQLVSQRVYGLCMGYEDLNDHEQLRYDPLFATVCQQTDVEGARRRRDSDIGKALAGKSTLQRLESTPRQAGEADRYHRIYADAGRIERFFVEHFLSHYNGGRQPGQIIIDLDATNDPLHGDQEGRFFNGYYDEYCYLPLYIFVDDYLLAAKLRSAETEASHGADGELERIVAQIREKWPKVRIIVRADSGFARDWLMSWCETHHVDYVFGLQKNARLSRAIGWVMYQARMYSVSTGKPAREYQELSYRTKKSWSRTRRVVGKAEYTCEKENPRFVVTSLSPKRWAAQRLYEQLYCARGDMENRIKEQQLYLFADRTSAETMRANQIRLWFSSVAYLLMHELRLALRGTELERAQCHTIRTKILKIGARVVVSTRRIVVHLASGYPYQWLFRQSLHRLQTASP